MARKVFISFLGLTNYKECRYYKGEFCSESVRYIQEATLDYLLKKESWNENDIAYILLTNGAKKSNWVDNGHKNHNTMEPIIQEGLNTRLKNKRYPFVVKIIEQLPDGKDEKELFEIFRKIYDILEPNDHLYFDITHGFRSLPMLALVLENYSKFLKNIVVKSITYGNYEASDEIHDNNNNVYRKAPIIDLLPLSKIQDWTFAAADYLRNGNAKRIKELITDHRSAICRGLKEGNKDDAEKLNDIANSLERFVNDFQTCRGLNILSGNNVTKLRKNLVEYGNTLIDPLNPIIEKVKDSFDSFEDSSGQPNLKNGFEAAKWCISHNLYQQAATILQENIVSFFCSRYKLSLCNKEERNLVNITFAYHKKLLDTKTSKEDKDKILETIKDNSTIKQLFDDTILSSKEIIEEFGRLTDERNDINHSGMRDCPHDASTIRRNIVKAYNTFYNSLYRDTNYE